MQVHFIVNRLPRVVDKSIAANEKNKLCPVPTLSPDFAASNGFPDDPFSNIKATSADFNSLRSSHDASSDVLLMILSRDWTYVNRTKIDIQMRSNVLVYLQ